MNKYEKDLSTIMVTMKNQCNREYKDILNRFDSIKELVKRATPKKVNNENVYIKCPSCNTEEIRNIDNFCWVCGQALE